MYTFMKDLNEVAEALLGSANTDWSENDPNLEFQTMYQQVQDLIQKINLQEPIDRLSHYVSEDDVAEGLKKLQSQAEIDGNVQADDIVSMWQPLEFKFTVDELLDQIGL